MIVSLMGASSYPQPKSRGLYGKYTHLVQPRETCFHCHGAPFFRVETAYITSSPSLFRGLLCCRFDPDLPKGRVAVYHAPDGLRGTAVRRARAVAATLSRGLTGHYFGVGLMVSALNGLVVVKIEA